MDSARILAGTNASMQTERRSAGGVGTPPRAPRRIIRAIVVTVILVLLYAPGARAAYPLPLVVAPGKGAVASDHLPASRAGAEVLAKGGNAADAAVATALALGVVAPSSSGLGGGGFLTYWDAKKREVRVLDFREVAPKAATRDMFLEEGRAVAERSRTGGLAVAVPSEAAGLAEIAATLGKLGLAADVQPALRLAREGFPVSQHQARAAADAVRKYPLAADDPLRAIVLPDGKPLKVGQTETRPELARTLATIAQKGKDGFYRGWVAQEIVDAVKRSGGVLTADDLAAYRPEWKKPLTGSYRGRTVYAPPPPSGGATTIEILQILDARPPLGASGPGSSASDQELAEAFKHAFADRARSLGDPAFVEVPTQHLTDPAYAKELAQRISPTAVQKPERYGDKSLAGAPAEAPHDHGTSHLCVVDGEGNVASLTTTINLSYGAKLVAGKSGVLLNDEMDDFSAQPGVPNYFGLIGAFANAIAPGKRPLSSMSPLIVVKDGKPELCVGGSGGPLIVSETVQSLVNVIDFGMNAEAAVSSPRVHAQWVPDGMTVEPEVPADVVEGLKKRGQHVMPADAEGAAQLIVIHPDRLEAASDPRKGGAPAAP